MIKPIPVLNFVPRAELDAAANLSAFVDLCRASDVLGASTQFESNAWDIGYLKGQNKVHRAIFSTLEASAEAKPEPSMPAPFLDFAKATTIYLQDKRPVESQAPRIAALRSIEAALRQLNKASRPTAVNPDVLDAAVELAYAQTSAAVAYRTAGQIEAIATFMNDKAFIHLRQVWKHGRKRPTEGGTRISVEALKARQEKLPSRAALQALAGIFLKAVEVPDVLISSNTALMICAPERINEVVRLRRKCIVEGDGEFMGKLGIRWAGSKGFENTTKWLPTAMGPVAQEAVSNLLRVTEPANELARWYTKNPNAIYLHAGAQHLRNRRMLSHSDIALILWGDEFAVDAAKAWAKKTHDLTPHGDSEYLFADMEQKLLAMLPGTFPYMPGDANLKCEDAMAVMRVNELHSARGTYLCMFTTVDYQTITNPYGAREGRASIFDRFQYTEDDGSSIKLKSHALRHYLNMLAQTGGLSSAEIALFSGRKDQKQNRSYDHMTSEEVQAPIADALRSGFTAELEPVQVERRIIPRDEFIGLGIRAGHTTKYGWCEHNFASEPCPMARDCMNCQEHECIKGDSHKEANLRALKTQTEYFLGKARQALGARDYGADTWVAHHTKTLERVNALLAIFEDPNVPSGARVRLDVDNAPLITKDNVQPIKFVRRSRHKALA
ncbi:integrase [Hydrogenophaga taeniospiralis]|uniref:integrase n=1 Tax=Hydrogenophaga taeniospiralis TaxID=65656 RepID=UPI001CFA059D|nr:integrase [Hydrogenophaga taeniospiralis]MCB4363313.1 integrase [Hydrogenophaga taeniospiralis]